jgi:uncharacterized protein (DUF433 family)
VFLSFRVLIIGSVGVGRLLFDRRIFPGRTIEAMASERIIVVDTEVMNGIPCFRGTRVPFKNLMDYLEGGHSLGEFLDQFPSVTREMAIQALQEAQESLLDRIA